jgi:hypothetical protein
MVLFGSNNKVTTNKIMAGVNDNLIPIKSSEQAREMGKKSSRKGIPNTKTRLKRILELEQKLKNPVTGEIETFTVAEQMDIKIIEKARKGDIKAYNAILDRLEGKPNQVIDQNVNGQLNVALVEFIGDDNED